MTRTLQHLLLLRWWRAVAKMKFRGRLFRLTGVARESEGWLKMWQLLSTSVVKAGVKMIFHLNNYFRLRVCLSFLLLVCLLVCVKSKKCASQRNWNHLLSLYAPRPPGGTWQCPRSEHFLVMIKALLPKIFHDENIRIFQVFVSKKSIFWQKISNIS